MATRGTDQEFRNDLGFAAAESNHSSGNALHAIAGSAGPWRG